MEISPIYHNSRPEGKLPAQEATAFDFLDSLGIDYERVTHELADTMEKCDDVSAVLGVDVCKNLFLCNRQKTNFYLLCMPLHLDHQAQNERRQKYAAAESAPRAHRRGAVRGKIKQKRFRRDFFGTFYMSSFTVRYIGLSTSASEQVQTLAV